MHRKIGRRQPTEPLLRRLEVRLTTLDHRLRRGIAACRPVGEDDEVRGLPCLPLAGTSGMAMAMGLQSLPRDHLSGTSENTRRRSGPKKASQHDDG
jgi:hypothetical protein